MQEVISKSGANYGFMLADSLMQLRLHVKKNLLVRGN